LESTKSSVILKTSEKKSEKEKTLPPGLSGSGVKTLPPASLLATVSTASIPKEEPKIKKNDSK